MTFASNEIATIVRSYLKKSNCSAAEEVSSLTRKQILKNIFFDALLLMKRLNVCWLHFLMPSGSIKGFVQSFFPHRVISAVLTPVRWIRWHRSECHKMNSFF